MTQDWEVIQTTTTGRLLSDRFDSRDEAEDRAAKLANLRATKAVRVVWRGARCTICAGLPDEHGYCTEPGCIREGKAIR